jgi:hypothetical protein
MQYELEIVESIGRRLFSNSHHSKTHSVFQSVDRAKINITDVLKPIQEVDVGLCVPLMSDGIRLNTK